MKVDYITTRGKSRLRLNVPTIPLPLLYPVIKKKR